MLNFAKMWGKTRGTAQSHGDNQAISSKIPVETRLEILAQLVLKDGLDEYFRHSSYSVNAYIKTGSKCSSFLRGKEKVTVVVSRAAAHMLKTHEGAVEDAKG